MANVLRDRFGGTDLPTQWHVPVSGEQHFFLPSELAGNQQQAPAEQAPYDPNVGPTPVPPQQAPAVQQQMGQMPVSSLRF